MKSYFKDVEKFVKEGGQYWAEVPHIPNEETVTLRENLIVEEYEELMEAMDKEDLPKIAKECADLVYVLMGAMSAYGIPFDDVWKLVQDNNMKKIKLPKNEIGKIIKPKDWKNADDDVKTLIEDLQKNV